ncbi:hypothetical protein L1987_80763 [Smallanthus sonchifolius]|uniref:Uncharacterized protein n=1 Tax=Smallanthus sonchifolius TaxID=185202 RepID=A0ACB8YP80_9ASTR|nr:hypothetical protein L1987_80763 [Smallanthus sonchifolius]
MPSVGKGHIICIASSFPVATLGGTSEQHPLPSEGSETEPSEESLTSPSPVGYGGPSQIDHKSDNALLNAYSNPILTKLKGRLPYCFLRTPTLLETMYTIEIAVDQIFEATHILKGCKRGLAGHELDIDLMSVMLGSF